MTVSLLNTSSQLTQAWNESTKRKLQLMAYTIRCLTMDAVQQAGSGHAGTPMGCAELGAYLYGFFLRHHLKNPAWPGRDRFILSAGHASMLQYSCLHLCGADLTKEDLRRFRQLNSRTPSHPQYGLTAGIETTTGVDGQGVAHAVGQALGIKHLAARYNKKSFSLFDAKVVVLAGDGCLMEGVSHEACALAGHLRLNNLILIYDNNKTCLDGLVTDSTTEDTKKRFQAYGWKVYKVDGHNLNAIHLIFAQLRKAQTHPCLVIADTVIGSGVAQQAGLYQFHSGPIAPQEKAKIKKAYGFPDEEFFVPKELTDFFAQKAHHDASQEREWNALVQQWQIQFPALNDELQKMSSRWLPNNIEELLINIQIPASTSGRKSSHYVLNFLAGILPGLLGGSADLGRSDMTHLDHHAIVAPMQFGGRNIKYGVREFGMASIAIGLAQSKLITPFIGTFLAFSDYMLNAVRMAAMMKLPIVYQLTHDSIFVGQDGPTHQPVEHIAHLRAIPHLQVIRPADANEVKMAWLAALKYNGPTALILSRQALPGCVGTQRSYAEGMGRGAYIIKKESFGAPDFTLIATGSEVFLALEVALVLEKLHLTARVVSMPCWELFDEQPETYRKEVLGTGKKVSIEAASEIGWHKYVLDGDVISVPTFGKSSLPEDLAQEFGFTVDAIVKRITKPRSRL